jgi:hypothetical protein
MGYNPRVRQIAIATNMPVIDSARFMALVTIAEADAAQSVYAAKWYYHLYPYKLAQFDRA